jgi:serralysin
MTKPSFTTAQAALQLNRDGLHWGPLGQAQSLSYAFRLTDSASGDAGPGFSQFSAQQIAAAKLSLQAWSDVAQLTFTQVGDGHSNNATLLFGNYSEPDGDSAAYGYYPGDGLHAGNKASGASDGDVWINSAYDYEAHPVLWGYGQQTLTHELGHALGLEHPGDYDSADGGDITYADNAEYLQDSRQYTVMSYFSETNTGADFRKNGVEHYAPGPLLDDIAAAQRLYGANMGAETGNTTYGFHSNAGRAWYGAQADSDALIFCVWDAGGSDSFDFSGFTAAQKIDLRNEHFSDVGGMLGNVSISAAVLDASHHTVNLIENATGGWGFDLITGNEAANRLSGGQGADTLLGGDGDDVLTGGKGRDLLDGGAGSNVFTFTSTLQSKGAAVDTIVHLGCGDLIDISAIDADTTVAGNQAFHLVARLGRHPGEAALSYDAASGLTTLALDVDGNGKGDSRIHIEGDVHAFTGFVL